MRQQVSGAGSGGGGEGVELRRRVLTQCSLCLGYLLFDGEGVKGNREEAVRYFKMAAAAGCKEAEQVLGWMYNTGQWA